jgi:RNA polymerase primary sigma factor
MDVVANMEESQPDAVLIDESLRIEVLHLLKVLTRRESKILILYYGLDGKKAKTLEEVGVEFKLTRERIRQIKERALQKLRKNSASRNLLQYL